jgi:hypothetical protein
MSGTAVPTDLNSDLGNDGQRDANMLLRRQVYYACRWPVSNLGFGAG